MWRERLAANNHREYHPDRVHQKRAASDVSGCRGYPADALRKGDHRQQRWKFVHLRQPDENVRVYGQPAGDHLQRPAGYPRSVEPFECRALPG